MRRGRITGSSSLGYQVYLDDGSIVRGMRRKGRDVKDGLPMIGDVVLLDDQDQIVSFLPRTSVLDRPRVANLDQAAVTISAKQPDLSTFLLDKYLSACIGAEIPSFIVVTKWDLLTAEERNSYDHRLDWYRALGYSLYRIGLGETEDLEALRSKVEWKVTAFMGQTGVGKSSLANAIDPSFNRPIGRFDSTMGRGTHQTKEVVLFPFAGGFLADTPGFSDFRLSLKPEQLSEDFPGFGDFYSLCRFKGCLHNHIVGCAVEKAVKEGKLSEDSYQNYLKLLQDAMGQSRKEKKSSHSSRMKRS